MERATQRKPDLPVAVPAEVDDRALGREQVERPLESGGRRAGVHDQVATRPAASSGSAKSTPSAAATSARPASTSTSVTRTAGNRLSRRATQQPTMPAPTTATRSPISGAASHRALTAVSTVPASTARAGGTPSGTTVTAPRRHHVGGLVRVQAEHRAAAQLRRPLLHDADIEVAVLDRPREVPFLKRCPHGVVLAGGTPPRNTSVSVPRLTPEHNVRTSTSSCPGSDSATGRISPQPGARSQNACASASATSRAAFGELDMLTCYFEGVGIDARQLRLSR